MREAVQMGFTRIVMPAANVDPADVALAAARRRLATAPAELVGVRTVGEALDQLI